MMAIIFNMKMDVSFSTQLITSSRSINKFLVDSKKVYLLKKTNSIRLFFNDKYHTATISNVDSTKKRGEFEVSIVEVFADLIPGTTLPATAIYKTETLFNILFS